jgi:hypothetical protein
MLPIYMFLTPDSNEHMNTSFSLNYLDVYMYHEQDSLYPGHIGVTEEIKWMYRPSGF